MAGGAWALRGQSIKTQHSSVPSKRKEYVYYRHGLGTLRKDKEYDTDGMCEISQIDTSDYPFVKSAGTAKYLWLKYTGKVLDLIMCDGIIYAAVHSEDAIYMYVCDPQKVTIVQTYICNTKDNDPSHYALVRYNEFPSNMNPFVGGYLKKILLLPLFFSYDIQDNKAEKLPSNAAPISTMGTMFVSRLFSACKGNIFASEFNKVNSYSFDTADNSSSANAWMSTTQSNVKADGDITALAVYDGHVVLFKRDYMMQVYNNENPFRLVEIGSYGCISKKAVCEFDGKLAFISPQGLMLYSGGYPYFIGEELNVKDWSGSMLCAGGKYLYVYVASEKCVYVYDAEHNTWGHRDSKPLSFMCADHNGAYYVRNNDIIRFGGNAPKEFSLTTDRNSLGYNGRKRISSIGFTAILGDGAELYVDLIDDAGTVYETVSVIGAGEHMVSEKIKGVSLTYAQLTFRGKGEVKIGEYRIKFRKEDE